METLLITGTELNFQTKLQEAYNNGFKLEGSFCKALKGSDFVFSAIVAKEAKKQKEPKEPKAE